MNSFSWDELVTEMSDRCPVLFNALLVAMRRSKKEVNDVGPCIGMCYAILMQTRNNELSLVQGFNTVLMTNGGAKKQLYVQCQKMGFSLSHTSKINMLDLIGGHFSDKLFEEVRCGKKIQGTGGNWDMKIHAQDMLSTNRNTDLQYFVSNLIIERVPSENLSNVSPQLNISSLHNTAFLIDSNKANKLRDDIKVVVGRALLQKIPDLSFLRHVIPNHIAHPYKTEMSKKSIIVPLPMMMKDEKEDEDVVHILDGYEQHLENIFVKADVIKKPVEDTNSKAPPIIGRESASADQAKAHFNNDDENDYMKKISVPFGRGTR
ncbi:Hypothetical predicted protein [Paramuricea clavata]|uniref:Uncharacterized protein n=1 Tax=Paramuricea clavata TaxID=317549 RepID=A0A6S7G2L2_PARCT|nr:Hypothetical predicted protein [Paramuricea clavata]